MVSPESHVLEPARAINAGKVCYEIGNRHATLFAGNDHNEFITIYNEPMKEMLEKIGANVSVEEVQFDFDKSISSSINSHHH